MIIKTRIDDMHTIFLLKKNIKSDIIKTILEYLPIVALESLKKWKIVAISVRQEYKSTEDRQDYRTGSESEEKIELINRLFKVFNADRTKNREVTRYVLLELEINEHRENWCSSHRLKWHGHVSRLQWLVKHNSEVNWNKRMV